MTLIRNEDIVILLVEDDEGHARLIERNLRRSGIKNNLIHFSSGNAFIDFLFDEDKTKATISTYFVLLDLNLPETDGYEILRLIKGDPVKHTIPVVVLTTTTNPREVARCYELGCNMYITKPVDYDSFSESMNKLATMLSLVTIPNG